MSGYGNMGKLVAQSQPDWDHARNAGLLSIRTTPGAEGRLVSAGGHEFFNLVSCSYLGLNRHPALVEGAIEAIRGEGLLSTSVSRCRIAPKLLDDVEALMSELFRADAFLTPSCAAASAGVLPLLASGHLTGGHKPLMVFDRNCHFSMNIMKAACANDTAVVTCAHNDVEGLEQLCRQHTRVAYIADGAYSMGGNAPFRELQALQDRYGLFLYLDDSHSVSICGERGIGLARSAFGELPEHTIIVASLAKAFGASGGLVLLGGRTQRRLLDVSGGPLGWSQMLNTPSLGAVRASARLHFTPELSTLQGRLRATMQLIDAHLHTENAGNGLPIRVIDLPHPEAAIDAAAQLYGLGYYCSAVFFPIVAKGRAGIRVMGRADLQPQEVTRFCRHAQSIFESCRARCTSSAARTSHPAEA
jgi:7-keto-8-aminopelargonate synthetase-like enzyme